MNQIRLSCFSCLDSWRRVMERKRSVIFKKDHLSLEWDGYVLWNGEKKIDLNLLTCILPPLRTEIREFLSLRHNSNWKGMRGICSDLRIFNTYLHERNLIVKSYADLNQKLWIVF